jgi:hypothetical protein
LPLGKNLALSPVRTQDNGCSELEGGDTNNTGINSQY